MYYSIGNGNGILLGGPPNDYTTIWSSRLSELELDNGPLTSLCAPGYGC